MDLLDDGIVPEDVRDVKADAREFAEAHIEPNAAEYFDSGEYPWEILEAGMDVGLVAGNLPAEYGGRDFGVQEMLAIAEEFFRADAGIGLTLSLASFGANILAETDQTELKEEYVRPVAENDQLTGLAVSEPETGSDLSSMRTTAERDGDEWVLNGEKYWIGNGVEADWVTLYAKTGDDPENPYGNYSLFVVPTDSEGYQAEHIPEKIAFRASKQAHITLEDCRIPEDHLIGDEPGQGFHQLIDFFNHGRVVVAGHGLGLAAAAIEEASSFVHDREAWGQRVADFQSVKHSLAEMRMAFESARTLTWRAADAVETDRNAAYYAALAKTTASEAATECAEEAMQLHGGRSVLAERRISRIYRDVRVPVIYEGANPIQRDLIYGQAPR